MINFVSFRELTRLEQSIFGLPIVVAGALLPCCLPGASVELTWGLWKLGVEVLIAFLLARITGMAFNQLIDCDFDIRNPRTQKRPIPSGRVSQQQARWIAWGGLSTFLLVCFQINTICAFLAPLAACLLFVYSYLKRVHYSCHFVLGIIHFLGPVMAGAALTGRIEGACCLLGIAACTHIVGNDILYAIQDLHFDRAHKLYSIPVRYGIPRTLWYARGLHGVCLMALLGVGKMAALPLFYYALVPLLMGIWIGFHRSLWHSLLGTPSSGGSASYQIEPVFFLATASASLLIGVFMSLGILWRVMS